MILTSISSKIGKESKNYTKIIIEAHYESGYNELPPNECEAA